MNNCSNNKTIRHICWKKIFDTDIIINTEIQLLLSAKGGFIHDKN